MAIVFPASPSVNETFTEGSITYKWDGAKWIGLGITPADRLVEGSNSLEINASNNLIWTGNNVGIGTNNPQQLLDVASTAPNIRLTDTVDGHSEIDGNAAELKFNADKGNTKANSKITFFVDNSEKLCITSDGKIGVNQVTPIAIFHAKSGANDGSLVSTFEGATNNKLNIRFDTFGPVLDVTAGDPLVFEIGGDEKLRIKSTGTVGFNNPTYNSNALIQTDAKDTTAYAPPTAYPVNQIELQNSVSMGSAIMRFRSQSDNASAGIWNIGAVPRTASLVSDFVFQSRTADSTYTEIARFSGDGGLKLGAGRGIDFSSNANAAGMTSEVLDDYEEGTWTPANQYLTITNNQTARYIKIGKMVTLTFDFTFASSPNGGSQTGGYLQGIPFTLASESFQGKAYEIYNSNGTVDTGLLSSILQGNNGATVYFRRTSDGDRVMTRAELASRRIAGTFVYKSD